MNSHGKSIQCVITPTRRWSQECIDVLNHSSPPPSFRIKICPFDCDESTSSTSSTTTTSSTSSTSGGNTTVKDVYSQHKCSCEFTYSHGFVCKHIAFVLYNIRKFVPDNVYPSFPYDKYVWVRVIVRFFNSTITIIKYYCKRSLMIILLFYYSTYYFLIVPLSQI